MNFFDYLMEDSKALSKYFILGDTENIAFDDLYKNSLRIASFLTSKYGSGRNMLLIAPNSVFFVTVYLGILKSGNVCVPVDHAIEQSNLDYISDLTQSPVIFCSEKIVPKLDFMEGMELIVEKDLLSMTEENNATLESTQGLNELAEIVFTSGSTGRPKGVMLSHGNLIANTESILAYLKLTEKDRICTVLPFHYCYGLSLLHTHLKVGGSMVLNNSFMFIGAVINDIKKHKCTGFSGVPSHFQILLKKSSFFENDNLPHLKYLTQAGGKLHDHFIKEIYESFPQKKFFVMYGQTEATSRLSYLSPDCLSEKLGSIGKPIPGVEMKIINDQGQDCDIDEEGELMAKGENIMMGYYLDEKETAASFKDGWLCTGDLARMDKEGFFYIVGRKKEFIKVRGKRVSPKEIEEVILRIKEVVDCKIGGYNDDLTGEGIFAKITISETADIESVRTAIIQSCRNDLAEHKVPTKFEFREKLDMKTSGKT